jgi:hypothetical protein
MFVRACQSDPQFYPQSSLFAVDSLRPADSLIEAIASVTGGGDAAALRPVEGPRCTMAYIDMFLA